MSSPTTGSVKGAETRVRVGELGGRRGAGWRLPDAFGRVRWSPTERLCPQSPEYCQNHTPVIRRQGPLSKQWVILPLHARYCSGVWRTSITVSDVSVSRAT